VVGNWSSVPAAIDPAAYPSEAEADIVLRDGSTVHVRPARREDRDALRAFLGAVSQDAIWFRFFSMANLDWAADWAATDDYRARFGLVVETGPRREIIAHATYVRDGNAAEVAFLVSDAWQGHGIATILLAHLAARAASQGISTFVAEVLPSNYRMIRVFRESGFAVDVRRTSDAIHVEFPTSMTAEATARFHDRDRAASVAAVSSVLAPQSVVVVGASRRSGTVGGELLGNILEAGFTGSLYAVNEHGGSVQGIEAYRSVSDLPGPVELAVVVVPAARVVPVARECVAAGARALVVISAGFAEVGGGGTERQRELLALCRASGVRLVGPNCLGVLNTRSDVQLNATFMPQHALPGAIAFLSQSGGLGIAIIEAAARLGIGISSFVSVGNKADLSSNDFLQYWEQDPTTNVALLYLESFGNPRKFARVGRRFSHTKPVVAVKSGRSAAGQRGTASHTGALLAASDVTVDALFQQAGVIRTDSLSEMFDVAAFLSKQPVPSGDRVAIVTNAGGPGIVCADACQAAGVQVPEPSPGLAARLASQLPEAASVANPIDMIATASAADYAGVVERIARSGEFDVMLTIFVTALVTGAHDVAAAIRQTAASNPGCAIAAVFMTAEGAPAELSADGVSVPGYQFPEEAARAVGHAARYAAWRARPEGAALTAEPETVAAGAALIGAELAGGSGWMSPEAVDELLSLHGVAQAPARIAGSVKGAVAAARELGWPVALKAVAPGLVHKRDVGAVATSLRTPAELQRAAQAMKTSVAAAGYEVRGLMVQPMITDGVELIIGMVQDVSFGPVMACGAGGTHTELLKDVAVRITPVTDLDAAEMLRTLKLYPVLTGYRGAATCDIGAVESLLQRISAMVDAHPEIAELDCNPVIARPDGAVVVDARIRLHEPEPPRPVPSVGR
jgi:acetate---CoA ligase (ADP-forming)